MLKIFLDATICMLLIKNAGGPRTGFGLAAAGGVVAALATTAVLMALTAAVAVVPGGSGRLALTGCVLLHSLVTTPLISWAVTAFFNARPQSSADAAATSQAFQAPQISQTTSAPPITLPQAPATARFWPTAIAVGCTSLISGGMWVVLANAASPLE